MNVVDSSGWLEYFTDGPNAEYFEPVILDTELLVVPTISVYEVFKRVRQERGEESALEAAALMLNGSLVELTASLALDAAKLSMELKLPMADSIILATARSTGATLWTQDADFEGVEGVRYRPKRVEV
jgi:toxin FitB